MRRLFCSTCHHWVDYSHDWQGSSYSVKHECKDGKVRLVIGQVQPPIVCTHSAGATCSDCAPPDPVAEVSLSRTAFSIAALTVDENNLIAITLMHAAQTLPKNMLDRAQKVEALQRLAALFRARQTELREEWSFLQSQAVKEGLP